MATIAPVGSLNKVQALTRPASPVIPNFLRPSPAAPGLAPLPPVAPPPPPLPVAPLAITPPPLAPLPVAPLPVTPMPELAPPPVVNRPTPPMPRPRPERPVPAPAPTPAPDSFKPQTLIALPDVRPGQTFQVQRGHYDGYDFGGTAQVLANDGKTLSLRVNAKVFFVSATVDLKLELQPDGTAKFSAVKHGDAAAQGATSLSIKSQKPGEVVLAGADGQLVKVQATPDGGLALSFGQNHVLLRR